MSFTNIARTNGTFAITLAGLPTSASLLTGRSSDQVHTNATDTQWLDLISEGFITVGTTPVADTSIQIWAYGRNTSLATKNLAGITENDAAVTLVTEGVRNGSIILAQNLQVDSATSDREYPIRQFSFRNLFNGLPEYCGVFVTHDTGVNLNATAGNHAISWQGLELETTG